MKIFNWMQSKLTGKPQIKKPNLKLFDDDHKVQKPPKEDEQISEWPHALLTIGTLGSNHDLKEDHLHSNPPLSPRDPLHDFTLEEAIHLQNELNSFFNEQVLDPSISSAEELGKFLNRQSSLKLAERTSNNAADFDEPKENFSSRFQRSASVVLGRGKDLNLGFGEHKHCHWEEVIVFSSEENVCLQKWVFTTSCSPSLRDPIPESRMEKILRAILHKKIYPQQSPNSTLSKKKYLENRHMTKSVTANEEQLNDKGDDSESDDDGSKWVKTDSEYIVLEI